MEAIVIGRGLALIGVVSRYESVTIVVTVRTEFEGAHRTVAGRSAGRILLSLTGLTRTDQPLTRREQVNEAHLLRIRNADQNLKVTKINTHTLVTKRNSYNRTRGATNKETWNISSKYSLNVAISLLRGMTFLGICVNYTPV